MEPRCTRRVPRHLIVIDVEVIDLESGIQIRERTKDLSLYGCGVSTATPFPAGTKVMLKMAYGPEKITAFGKVIYGRPDIGMGIVFTTVAPEDHKIIEEWIANLACPSPKLCPPVISTGYGIAIHRQSAIALAHDRHACTPGRCNPPTLPQSSQSAARKPRSSPATRGTETKASQTKTLSLR